MTVQYVPYLIPRTGQILVSEDVERYVHDYLVSHVSDHRSMFTFMNELLNVTNNPLLHFSEVDLLVNIHDMASLNNFLLTNNRQHKVMYDSINKLGLLATPVFNVFPINTNWLSVLRLDRETVSQFVTKEHQVHMMIMRATNLLAEALQYVP